MKKKDIPFKDKFSMTLEGKARQYGSNNPALAIKLGIAFWIALITIIILIVIL